MPFPSPEQAVLYPSISKMLENFLWANPEGGTFKVARVEGPQGLVEKLKAELTEAGWEVGSTELQGMAALVISPKVAPAVP